MRLLRPFLRARLRQLRALNVRSDGTCWLVALTCRLTHSLQSLLALNKSDAREEGFAFLGGGKKAVAQLAPTSTQHSILGALRFFSYSTAEQWVADGTVSISHTSDAFPTPDLNFNAVYVARADESLAARPLQTVNGETMMGGFGRIEDMLPILQRACANLFVLDERMGQTITVVIYKPSSYALGLDVFRRSEAKLVGPSDLKMMSWRTSDVMAYLASRTQTTTLFVRYAESTMHMTALLPAKPAEEAPPDQVFRLLSAASERALHIELATDGSPPADSSFQQAADSWTSEHEWLRSAKAAYVAYHTEANSQRARDERTDATTTAFADAKSTRDMYNTVCRAQKAGTHLPREVAESCNEMFLRWYPRGALGWAGPTDAEERIDAWSGSTPTRNFEEVLRGMDTLAERAYEVACLAAARDMFTWPVRQFGAPPLRTSYRSRSISDLPRKESEPRKPPASRGGSSSGNGNSSQEDATPAALEQWNVIVNAAGFDNTFLRGLIVKNFKIDDLPQSADPVIQGEFMDEIKYNALIKETHEAGVDFRNTVRGRKVAAGPQPDDSPFCADHPPSPYPHPQPSSPHPHHLQPHHPSFPYHHHHHQPHPHPSPSPPAFFLSCVPSLMAGLSTSKSTAHRGHEHIRQPGLRRVGHRL